jgi:hypothetical protein
MTTSTSTEYEPAWPGYTIPHLGNAPAFDRCQRDRVPCLHCGHVLDAHGFDTLCPSPAEGTREAELPGRGQ